MNRLMRLLKNPRITPSLLGGILLLLLVVLWSWLAPLFVDTELSLVGAVPPSQAPNSEYLLGTDSQGRDILAVMVVATPQTLRMGLIAGAVGIGVGLLLGLLSGYFGGPLDTFVRIFADSLMTVPGIAILIIIAANVEAMSIEVMALTVASLAWMYPTRTIRAQVLSIRERPYTAVARANGEREVEILFREVMPNLLPYVAASLVVAINGAILATVGLESLGLGAENVHTLGTTIYWARRYSAILRGQWWWWGPPIGIISLIFIGLFLLSMGLDRFVNPTLSSQPKLGTRARRRQQMRKVVQHDSAQASSERGGTVTMPATAPGTWPETLTAPPDGVVLHVQDLHVSFETPSGSGPAVDGVTFSLRPGERMGLIGESGCGKTTLALAIMSLIRPPGHVDSGHIYLDGQDLLANNDIEMRRVRLKEVALVPQAAMNALNPVMRIKEQIIDAIVAHDNRLSQPELNQMVETALKQVGLAPSVANRFPHELSGGMKQRATMAIATVLQPKLIIADEPTSALDVVVQRRVMLTLARVQKELGAATVLIGHDMGLIAQFSDSVGVLYAGKLVERGPVDDVLQSPRHPYTRLLIESLPSLTLREEFIGIPGLPPALFDKPSGCYFHPRCPYAFERCRAEAPAVQSFNGHQVACHLYPEHTKLPPLPADSAVFAMDAAPAASKSSAADSHSVTETS